jgi:glutamate synthase (ferredoxin)
MIGRADRLEMKKAITHWKAQGLDFAQILAQPEVEPGVGRYCTTPQDHGLATSLDVTKLLGLCRPAIEHCQKVRATVPIKNVHRVVGTMTGSEITKKYGPAGLPDGTIELTFTGSAGQSFGAFIPRGMTLALDGDANDYVGKGLSGGRVIVYPPAQSSFVAEENIIIGNVALYGATSGEAFIRGVAGERFCVRNSGATAVVEGCGDHGCEYMTGGCAVILGPTGRNFAAGMSGGIAYVFDETGDFATRCNKAGMGLGPVTDDGELADLKKLIERHGDYTKSTRAWKILSEWDRQRTKFVKVLPKDYARVLESLKKAQAAGLTGDEAAAAAFEENVKDVSRVGGN